MPDDHNGPAILDEGDESEVSPDWIKYHGAWFDPLSPSVARIENSTGLILVTTHRGTYPVHETWLNDNYWRKIDDRED